jgi:flagellar motor switch protein FliM
MLTQAEIDALLSGALQADQPHSEEGVNLASLMGETDVPETVAAPVPSATASKDKSASTKQVRPYNFWSPDRFSKEQMRAVELVHENLAERLTSSLPSYIRMEFRPRVVHVEQGRSDDFLKDLPQGSLLHMLALDPLPGRMLMVISNDVVRVILARLLGGTGEVDRKPRPLSDIDQMLVKGTVEYMLNDLKAAWSKVVSLEPRLEDSTINHHWVQMVMGNARVLNVTFEIALPELTGTMSIYIPFSMLKPIANVLNPHAWIAGREEQRADDTARRLTMAGVQQVFVPFRVVLGHAELTMGELMGLRPGDVIQLEDAPAKQDLVIRVGDKPRFRGKVGMVGKRLAVQIASVLNEAGT